MSSSNDKKQRRLTSLLALIKIRIEDFTLPQTAIKEKLKLTSSNDQLTAIIFYNFIENQLKIPLTISDKEILQSEYLINKEYIDSKSFLSDINMYTDNLPGNDDYKHTLSPTNAVNNFDQTEKSLPNESQIQYDIELDHLKSKYNPESTSSPELPINTHNDPNYDPLNDSNWKQEKDDITSNAHIDSFTSFLNKLKLDSETSFDIDPSYTHHPTESSLSNTNNALAAAAADVGDDDIGQSILRSWKKLSTLADNTTVPTLPTTAVPFTNAVTAPYTSPYPTTHPATAPTTTTANPYSTTTHNPTHNNIEPEIVLSKSEHKLYTELLKHTHPIHVGKEIINKIHLLSFKKPRNNNNSLSTIYHPSSLTHTNSIHNNKGQNYDDDVFGTDGYISCTDLSDILVSTGLHLSHIDIELLSAGFSSDGKYSNIKGSELCQVIEEILYKIIHSNKIQNMLYNSSNRNNKDNNSCMYLLSNQENIAWMFAPMNIFDLPVRDESYRLASYDDLSIDYRRKLGDFEEGGDGRSGVEARLDPPSTLLVLIQLCHVFTRSLCSPNPTSEASPDVPPDLKRLLHLAITPPTTSTPHTPTTTTTNTYINNSTRNNIYKWNTITSNKSMKEYLKSKETYLTYLQKLAVKPFLLYDNNKTGRMNISQFIVPFSDVFPDVPTNILHSLIAVYTSSSTTSMAFRGDQGHNIDLTRSLPGPLSSTIYGAPAPLSRSLNMSSQEYSSSEALLYASSAFPATTLLDRSYRSDLEGEGDYASPYRTNNNTGNNNNNLYNAPPPVTTLLTPPRSALSPPPKINTTQAPPHTSSAPIKYKKFLREFLKVYEHFLYSDYCIHLASALDPTTNPTTTTNNNNIHTNTNSNKSIWFIKVFDVIHSLLVQLESMSYRVRRQTLVQLHHKLIPYITASSSFTTTATATAPTTTTNNNDNNALDGFQFIEILTEVGLIMTKDQRMQLLRVFEVPGTATTGTSNVGVATTVNYLQLSQVCISILLQLCIQLLLCIHCVYSLI